MGIAESKTKLSNGWSVPTSSEIPDCPRSSPIPYSKVFAAIRDTLPSSRKCACQRSWKTTGIQGVRGRAGVGEEREKQVPRVLGMTTGKAKAKTDTTARAENSIRRVLYVEFPGPKEIVRCAQDEGFS